jgi:hypothetical protein
MDFSGLDLEQGMMIGIGAGFGNGITFIPSLAVLKAAV